MANNYGYDEIVDTLYDACILDVSVQTKISDGLQLLDALQFGLEAYPKVQEAIQDWGTFTQEFLDLKADESQAVVDAIKAKLIPEEAAKSRVLRVLELLAFGYGLVDFNINSGKELIEKAKYIAAK